MKKTNLNLRENQFPFHTSNPALDVFALLMVGLHVGAGLYKMGIPQNMIKTIKDKWNQYKSDSELKSIINRLKNDDDIKNILNSDTKHSSKEIKDLIKSKLKDSEKIYFYNILDTIKLKNESSLEKNHNKMNLQQLKELVREVIKEEQDYQDLFRTMLDKTGKDINSMSDEEKKKFFNAVDKAYQAKSEGRLRM